MTKLSATLVILRLTIGCLGFCLGMAYTAWVFDHMGGLTISLMCGILVAAAWRMIERDLRDELNG